MTYLPLKNTWSNPIKSKECSISYTFSQPSRFNWLQVNCWVPEYGQEFEFSSTWLHWKKNMQRTDLSLKQVKISWQVRNNDERFLAIRFVPDNFRDSPRLITVLFRRYPQLITIFLSDAFGLITEVFQNAIDSRSLSCHAGNNSERIPRIDEYFQIIFVVGSDY